MGIQRKCSKCQTWNNDESHCLNCNELIDPVLIEEEREKIREEVRNSKPPTKLDLFIDRWKNSKYLILRILYKILYSIAVIFVSIATFFAWLAASPNG